MLREILFLSASTLLFTNGCVLTPHLDCCGHQVYCLLCLFVLLLEVDAKIIHFVSLEYTLCVLSNLQPSLHCRAKLFAQTWLCLNLVKGKARPRVFPLLSILEIK